MKRFISISALIITILIGSCTGIKVTSDYDKSVDFTKFTTYSYHGWAKNSDKLLNPFDKQRIENAFKNEFNNRGLKLVKEDGELVVALYIVTEQKTEQVANTTNLGGYYGWGYGGYYGHGPAWGWGAPMGNTVTTISQYNYTVGTLVVDVFDSANKKLIWEGIGTKTLDDNPATSEKSIPKSVAAIMAQYPIKPASNK